MKQVPNRFTSYDLTDDELRQGAHLHGLNKAYIQNLISAAATTKTNLTFNVTTPEKFIQDEAYYKGTIDALEQLLTASEIAEEEIKASTSPTTDRPSEF
jgi:hypothetical protein